MDTIDFKNLTPEEISAQMRAMKSSFIHEKIKELSHSQLVAFIQALKPELDITWEEKLKAGISGLTDKEALKLIGSIISQTQFLSLLDSLSFEKISDLLIDLPPELFYEILISVTPDQLQKLKYSVMTEPMQHHLTLLKHTLVPLIQNFDQRIFLYQQEIDRLNLQEFDEDELFLVREKLDAIQYDCEIAIELSQKALAIAWNTQRVDLIDELSSLKEAFQRYLKKRIHGLEGLFHYLENRLNGVYSDFSKDNPIESNQDHEYALEALIKLSLWHIEDYWEVGLLPEVKNKQELKLDAKFSSEEERALHHQKLFQMVQKNLEKLGLGTVLDLKNAQIFSKKSLKNFIKNNS